jgi:hypothetical protein
MQLSKLAATYEVETGDVEKYLSASQCQPTGWRTSDQLSSRA